MAEGWAVMKALSVLGTRPEAIKMAPVIRELERHPDQVVSRVCVTAQHRAMLDSALALFGITPHYDLNVMRAAQSPTRVAATVLARLEPVLRAEQPDWVLVQGDTTTVATTAIAAFYAGIRVAHVEAGLRTYQKRDPFPEEVNRRIAGVVADRHFVPTETARANLLSERVPPEAIILTGNPVIDALHIVSEQPYCFARGPLTRVPWEKRILVVTAHRRENLGQPLEAICRALCEIARRYRNDVHIVYPVHLNPQVWQPVHHLLSSVPGITLTRPLDYLPFVHLLKRSHLVLTDSGGLQEEAPGLGKPVLVLRNVTERPEGVAAGTVKLVGTDCQRIVAATARLLEDDAAYQRMAHAVNPYGDGHAAQRIVANLIGGSLTRQQAPAVARTS